jgi:hypothetical protein
MISSLDPSPSVTHGNERPPVEVSLPFLDTVVSGASHRIRALSALSGSLTDALDPENAAHLLERQPSRGSPPRMRSSSRSVHDEKIDALLIMPTRRPFGPLDLPGSSRPSTPARRSRT